MNENSINPSKIGLTILVIATRKYVSFAQNLIATIEANVDPKCNCQILMFTDQPEHFKNVNLRHHTLEIIQIPSLGWPYATLLRYSIFRRHFSLINGEFVMYLDADTEVARPIQLVEISSAVADKSVALVLHPGYFGVNRSLNRFLTLRIGPWESRRASTAYVQRTQRKQYVCGGVWMGRKEGIRNLVTELANHVDIDNSNGLIAKWHDESHLNYWFSKNNCSVLDPSWAFSDMYSEKLRDYQIDPIIRVIDKPSTWVK
jgi:hypothetical protein